MNKKKGDEAKYEVIRMRVTKEEKKRLKEYSALEHLSMSDYLREGREMRENLTRGKFGISDKVDDYDYIDEYEENDDEDFDF